MLREQQRWSAQQKISKIVIKFLEKMEKTQDFTTKVNMEFAYRGEPRKMNPEDIEIQVIYAGSDWTGRLASMISFDIKRYKEIRTKETNPATHIHLNEMAFKYKFEKALWWKNIISKDPKLQSALTSSLGEVASNGLINSNKHTKKVSKKAQNLLVGEEDFFEIRIINKNKDRSVMSMFAEAIGMATMSGQMDQTLNKIIESNFKIEIN